MTDDLLLRPLLPADEPDARAAHRELADEGFELILGLDEAPSWAELLASLERERTGQDLPPGRVPATFLVAVVDGRIVGRLSVRHRLNAYLATVGGHLGYAVRPAFRRRGYATDNEEHELGVACVATPILDHAGLPVAAISVSGPITRVLHADTADLAGILREHAQEVSAALGLPR